MSHINKAYEILSDPERRKEYDETGRTETVDKEAILKSALAQVLFLVISSPQFDPVTTDLVGSMRKQVEKMIEEFERQYNDALEDTNKLQRTMKRTKGDLLISLLEGQIGIQQRNAAEIQRKKEFASQVLMAISQCSYTFEASPITTAHQSTDRETFESLLGEMLRDQGQVFRQKGKWKGL